MSTQKIIALSVVGVIILAVLFLIAKNLTTTSTETGGGSKSTSTGGLGKILSWFGL